MNFDYFWYYTEKVQEEGLDIGFDLYSKGHLIWLLCLAVAAILVIAFYLRANDKKRARTRKAFAWFLFIGEIVKNIILLIAGADLINYLPLHLCGFTIFFTMADVYLKKNRITSQLMSYALGPGALCALLFCSWTALPVAMNYMSIFSFVFHGAIVTYVLMRLVAGEYRPTYGGIWIASITLIILAIPTYFVDMITDLNYMFIYKVQQNSPLVFIWNIFGTRFGQPGYLVGYALLALSVFHALFLLYTVLGFTKKK